MDVMAKTIEVDYQEWLKLHHKIDFLVDIMLAEYDSRDFVCDEMFSDWCEKHCGDKAKPDKECWLEYLERKVK